VPSITTKRVFVCEGFEDRTFIYHLGKKRQLLECNTFSMDELSDKGNSALARGLVALSNLPNFSNVDDVGIVMDADENEATTFAEICSRISAANSDPGIKPGLAYPIPSSPFQKANGKPSVTVIMTPGSGKPGCLDTLIWSVLKRQYSSEATCVETLLECARRKSGPDRWGQNALDKARVRAAIAVIHRQNPSLSLSKVWSDEKFKKLKPIPIPLGATEFNDLASHLSTV
jgi:hypothetical protein